MEPAGILGIDKHGRHDTVDLEPQAPGATRAALHRGREWSQVEPEIQRNWRHNYGPWDRFKSAIHYAWDRAHHH